MRKLTTYAWHTGKLTRPMTLMMASDLHDGDFEDILPTLENADCLLVAGDVVNRYRQSYSRGVEFLREAAALLPTYFSMGNHEARLDGLEGFCEAVRGTGAHLLFNRYERQGELVIGGWYRPERFGMPDFLDAFESEEGCRVLLCHRPEDYMRLMRARDIDLTLSGHAHGGQIRVCGQGLYAPGQGLLPRYTYGVYDRMILSSGAYNAVHMPRWGNPCEVVRILLD